MRIASILAVLGIVIVAACGSKNVTANRAPANEQEQAEVLMQNNDFAGASALLTTLLVKEPGNDKAHALHAASLAGQAGFTVFSLIKKTAENTTSGATGTTPQALFASVLPDYSEANRAYLKAATEAMARITAPTEIMDVQHGMFLSAYGFLILKKFLKADGTPNPDALATLSADDVTELLGAIASAVTVFGGADSAVGSKVLEFQEGVSSASGTTETDKLKSFLGG